MVPLSGGILGPPGEGSQGASDSPFGLCAALAESGPAARNDLNLHSLEAVGGRDEFLLRRDGQDLAGTRLLRALEQAVDRGRGFGESHRRRTRAGIMNEEERRDGIAGPVDGK